jgi:hypothetical protein
MDQVEDVVSVQLYGSLLDCEEKINIIFAHQSDYLHSHFTETGGLTRCNRWGEYTHGRAARSGVRSWETGAKCHTKRGV